MLNVKHTYNSIFVRRCRITPNPPRGRAYVKNITADHWIDLGVVKYISATTTDGRHLTFGKRR